MDWLNQEQTRVQQLGLWLQVSSPRFFKLWTVFINDISGTIPFKSYSKHNMGLWNRKNLWLEFEIICVKRKLRKIGCKYMKHIDKWPTLAAKQSDTCTLLRQKIVARLPNPNSLKIRIMIPFSYSLEWVPGHLFKIAAEIEWGDEWNECLGTYLKLQLR